MKMKVVVLESFRAYRERVQIEPGDIVALIGKNYVGKLTLFPRFRFSIAVGSRLPILIEVCRLSLTAERAGSARND